MTMKQRRIANFLLQPVVQLRVGVYNVVLSLVYVVLLGAFAYWRLGEFTEVVVTLTESDQQILSMLDDYMRRIALTAVVSGVLFVLLNVAVSIWLTHRLVGPTVAFRRHIKGLIAGDFNVRTRLRPADAFKEVAEDLNLLSESLIRRR